MTHKLSILLVEDEKNICDFISTSLSAQDYRISTAHTGKEALPIITSQCPDLILLDLGLPDMDGMEIIRQVRTWSSVPIIVLSARTQEQEKVRALDLGADDYLTKPFVTKELLARIRVALRKAAKQKDRAAETVLSCKGVELRPDAHEVAVCGEKVELTTLEFALLQTLLEHKNILMSRDTLIDQVWGYDYYVETNIVDVYIRYLRHKIDDRFQIHLISTVRGIGYVIKED